MKMPDVKVGTFSLPKSSALQITLVLQLARYLLRRMGFVIKALDPSLSADGDDTNNLMPLAFKVVKAGETDLIEKINQLRNTLISLEIL